VLLFVGLRIASNFALYVGVFIVALALSDLLHNTNVIAVPAGGRCSWHRDPGDCRYKVNIESPARARAGHRRAAGALGGTDVASYYGKFPTDRLVGPVLLVLLGVYVVTRGWSARRR